MLAPFGCLFMEFEIFPGPSMPSDFFQLKLEYFGHYITSIWFSFEFCVLDTLSHRTHMASFVITKPHFSVKIFYVCSSPYQCDKMPNRSNLMEGTSTLAHGVTDPPRQKKHGGGILTSRVCVQLS